MENTRQGRHSSGERWLHWLGAVGLGLMLALAPGGAALGQTVEVSGRVTSTEGGTLQGVTVRIRGTTTTTLTDAEGRYAIAAPADGVLLFGLIGYRGVGHTIGGRTSIDVVMETAIALLPEVVVTGYTEQRRADITGGVSSVDLQSVSRQTGVSVLQRLDGRVPGVTVENSGSPGSRTTVRVRGIGSFQNNDPLVIVDGTPVQDSYLNFLNPNEIASMQVLKDASAASIYGSRAGNGVIIVETKRGRPGRRHVQLDVRTGVATPVRGLDDILILDALEYHRVLKASYENAGLPVPVNIYGDPNNPTIPAYTYANPATVLQVDAFGRPIAVNENLYSYPDRLIMPGSRGTNWWDAVFGAGQVREGNLAVSGGGEDNAYLVSFNYFDQYGTAEFNRFQRGSVRINTAFNMGRVSVGENIALSREHRYGGLDDADLGEDNIIGKNIFQQPVVPIYDIAGNYASGKGGGLSNLTNPLKIAETGRNNIGTNDRMFGNVFGGLDAGYGISLRTRFGFNLGQFSFREFNPILPENSEPTGINQINENYNQSTDWTWSNTLNYARAFNRHNLTVLAGQEVHKNVFRLEAGSCSNLLSTNLDARYIQDELCDPSTKNVTTDGGRGAGASFFGKADYNFADRYLLSATLRRDGSSRLGPANRWGTFPAFGAGWRVSSESFFPSDGFLSSLMFRFGWGITGNEQIPAGRIVAQFGGDRGDTFYDIAGTNTSIRPGFKQTALGNPNLKWEENRSVNVGVDLEFLDGRGSFTADVYQRKTNNLLFDPRTPATAGSAAPPIVNIGKMKNNGFDFSIGYRGSIGAGTLWNVTFNGSRYKNELVQIDGNATFFYPANIIRDQNPVRNEVGYPIGSFYGLVADGYYVDSLDAAAYWDDGARPGRIRFRDLNNDGNINQDDRAIIGSPHPDFTAGLDLGLRRGNWDFSATLFGTFGNEIFDVQKYWYVFRYFNTNVRNDRLAGSANLDGPCAPAPAPRTDYNCSGRVTNPGAQYPRIDVSDVWSRQFSSYYVEDGSYVRLRNVQIGYNLPPALIRWIPAARIYVQAENLFTITGYDGLDPALPAQSVNGAAGDTRDQYRGIDQGSYPSNRTFTIGITTTF